MSDIYDVEMICLCSDAAGEMDTRLIVHHACPAVKIVNRAKCLCHTFSDTQMQDA